jgi:hypothetical protein
MSVDATTATQAAIEEEDLDGLSAGPKKIKPVGKWAFRIKYDPDKGFREADMSTYVGDYIKRFDLREGYKKSECDNWYWKDDAIKTTGRAVIQTVNRDGVWEAQTIDGYANLKAFYESEVGKKKRLMESGFDPMFDGGAGGGFNPTRLLDTEFIPIMAGPFFKQLYIYDYLYMHARAFELVNHNPLAASATKLLQRFTIGRGLSFHIKDDNVREVWDEFWTRNGMDKRIKGIARDINWQGEVMLKYLEVDDGRLSVRSLDPSTCWEVVTDPEDIEKVYYYHFQWPSQYQIWVSGRVPISQYFIQQIPPTNIQHYKINVSSMEKRGRSELLPGMPWLKRYDDLFAGKTLKAVLEANMVWVITVKGDQGDVDALQSSEAIQELPPPGGTWVQNEAVDLKPMSAGMAASRGDGGVGQEIANTFATSINLPGEYFNISGERGAARATALVRTDPAVKTIEEKQQVQKEILTEMHERVIATAILAGKLPRHAAKKDPELVQGNDPDIGKRKKNYKPGFGPGKKAQTVQPPKKVSIR